MLRWDRKKFKFRLKKGRPARCLRASRNRPAGAPDACRRGQEVRAGSGGAWAPLPGGPGTQRASARICRNVNISRKGAAMHRKY